MPFLDREQRIAITRVALAGTILFGVPVVSARDTNTQAEQQLAYDLGLRIDEARFFKAVNSGPQFGIITKTSDRNRMDCLKSLGDVCVADATTSNFIVALNKPMVDLLANQSKLLNPIRPVKMIFTEDWLDINENEHVGGFTGITAGEEEIHVVVSLKVAAYDAFRFIDRDGLSMDYFDGLLSFLISKYSVHEWGHAGAEAKKLARPSRLVPDEGTEDQTHPQVYAFDERYDQLYRQAEALRKAEGALLFVGQFKGRNLQAYKEQLYREAKAMGIY